MAAKKSPKSKVKQAKSDRPIARLATDNTNPMRKVEKNATWKKQKTHG